MMRRGVCAGLMCSVLLGSSLAAWGYPYATQQLVAQAIQGFFNCRLSAALDLLEQASTMPQATACVAQAKATLAPLYLAALTAVQGQEAAVSRLKDFYAAWLGGLDALYPAPREREAVYHGRVAGIQQKLTEMGHRLVLEAQ